MMRIMEAALAKVVTRKLDTKSGALSVGKKRFREVGGRSSTLRTIDAGSATFAADLTDVFAKNVAKARRENKLVVGKPDLVPAKG
jgi:hypothetical protein